MIEVYGDLWELAEDNNVDAIVITTNGDVNRFGKAVMGRGCALEAAKKFPTLPARLARSLAINGNIVQSFPVMGKPVLYTFPVKHHWHEKADPDLILKSTVALKDIADWTRYTKVILPRPGCGNGGLKWEDVKPIIEPYLDDRFMIVTNEKA